MKNKDYKIYARTIENSALEQIESLYNSTIGGDEAHIRIMPDAHTGAGCVIGTTMLVKDKVCPNVVGVDIGCGVLLASTNIDFKNNLEKLDKIIHDNIPAGFNIYEEGEYSADDYNFIVSSIEKLKCYKYLKKETVERALCSLGTLGGKRQSATIHGNVSK